MPWTCSQISATILWWKWAMLPKLVFSRGPALRFSEEACSHWNIFTHFLFLFLLSFSLPSEQIPMREKRRWANSPKRCRGLHYLSVEERLIIFLTESLLGGWNFCPVQNVNRCKTWSIAWPGIPTHHTLTITVSCGCAINICLKTLISRFFNWRSRGDWKGHSVRSKWYKKWWGEVQGAALEWQMEQVKLLRKIWQLVWKTVHIFNRSP